MRSAWVSVLSKSVGQLSVTWEDVDGAGEAALGRASAPLEDLRRNVAGRPHPAPLSDNFGRRTAGPTQLRLVHGGPP